MRTLFFIGFYLYVFAVLNSCASLNSEMILVYTDQNNNRYTITANEIEYKAIQPEESSSGIYSGGTDKIAPISSGDFKKLNSISELLFKEKSSHAIRREMMTSVLKRNYHGKSEQVILYTSENRTAFEILLKDLTTN